MAGRSTNHNGRGHDLRAHGFFAVLVTLSALALIGLSAICISQLIGMKSRDLGRAQQAAERLAATIEGDISRTIEQLDLSVTAVVDGLNDTEISQLPRRLRHALLFGRTVTAGHFGAIRAYDGNGGVTLESRPAQDVGNVQSEPFFLIHRGDPNAGIYVSPPFVAPNGAYAIAISRRLPAADGEFAGVVAGTLQLSFVHGLLTRLALDPGASVDVVHTDGQILMRSPFVIDDIGRNISGGALFNHLTANGVGTFETAATEDGDKQLFAYRRSDRYPFAVSVGVATDSILAHWREKAVWIGAVLAGLFLATIALTILLMQLVRKRQRQERRASVLATRDGLTALANRAHFDAVLEQSWAHSIQSRTPVSLLLIDCDRLGDYNERYGPSAGDSVLRQVARCVMTGQRPGELAARYEGEEFAVILPHCTSIDAFARAERIRQAVIALHWRHEGNPDDIVTVSIGAACVVAEANVPTSRLVEAADEALRIAAADGGNRSEINFNRAPATKPSRASAA